jgi:hypothetical protein
MSQKTWGGRFSGATDDRVEAFTESIRLDRRLHRHDVRASQAHARASRCPSTSSTRRGFNNYWRRRFIWLRLRGPGRVAIQSAVKHREGPPLPVRGMSAGSGVYDW